jgi:hypothetical protein
VAIRLIAKNLFQSQRRMMSQESNNGLLQGWELPRRDQMSANVEKCKLKVRGMRVLLPFSLINAMLFFVTKKQNMSQLQFLLVVCIFF